MRRDGNGIAERLLRAGVGRAEDLLRGSVEAIVLAGQSFVLVTAVEALAAVYSAQGRPRHAAMLLGAAHSTRDAAIAHMRPIQPPDEALRRSLVRALGAAAFDTAHAEGERMSPTQVLRSAGPQPGRQPTRGRGFLREEAWHVDAE